MTTTVEPGEPSRTPSVDAIVGAGADCPEWCQSTHEHDDWATRVGTGLSFRSHQGPSFGSHISVGAEQTPAGFEAPTAFVFDLDGAELGALALRDLARNARAAAEWCEENA
jgi:hypothetical protein